MTDIQPKPMDAGLIGHEISHLLAAVALGALGDHNLRILIGPTECKALGKKLPPGSTVAGPIGTAIAASSKPESVCQALLTMPIAVWLILAEQTSPSDRAEVLAALEDESISPADMDYLIRTITFLIWSFHRSLRSVSERVSERVGTSVGLLTANAEPIAELLKQALRASQAAAQLDPIIYTIPGQVESYAEKLDVEIDLNDIGFSFIEAPIESLEELEAA